MVEFEVIFSKSVYFTFFFDISGLSLMFGMQESYGHARKAAKESLKFSVGCELVLPPDSFLSLRLPFVYFTESEDGRRDPLLYKKDRPEQTAWLVKGSALFTLPKEDKVRAG